MRQVLAAQPDLSAIRARPGLPALEQPVQLACGVLPALRVRWVRLELERLVQQVQPARPGLLDRRVPPAHKARLVLPVPLGLREILELPA